MGTFGTNCCTGNKGVAHVCEFLTKKNQPFVVITENVFGIHTQELQLKLGDIIIFNDPDTMYKFLKVANNYATEELINFIIRDSRLTCLECKTEGAKSKTYNNFFLEEDSNQSIGRKGWMYQLLGANILTYCFLDNNVEIKDMYIIDFKKLKEMYDKFYKNKYPLRKQKVNEQNNDTYGYTVPIPIVMKDAGIKEYHY